MTKKSWALAPATAHPKRNPCSEKILSGARCFSARRQRRSPGAKALFGHSSTARLKPCPDTNITAVTTGTPRLTTPNLDSLRPKVKQQVAPLRYPGFPVEVRGVGELHAAFLTESRKRCHRECSDIGNPGPLRSG